MFTFDDKRKDVHLKEKLLLEGEGILNFLLECHHEYLKNGIKMPQSVETILNEYRSDNDSLGMFIKACCVEGRTKRANPSKLYNAYRAWCDNNGVDAISNNTQFGINVKKKGYVKGKSNGSNYWLGLELQSSEQKLVDTIGSAANIFDHIGQLGK